MKTMPEVGTLGEIGANVGDVVAMHQWMRVDQSKLYGIEMIVRDDGGVSFINQDGRKDGFAPTCPHHFRMIRRASDAKPGPVREVTRKEIVAGRYGIINVATTDVPDGQIWIGVSTVCTTAELRAAAAHMIEIADALEAK